MTSFSQGGYVTMAADFINPTDGKAHPRRDYVIQKLDNLHHPILEWRTWEAFQDPYKDPYREENRPVGVSDDDFYRANSVTRSFDGNLIVSFRNVHQVVKIDSRSGKIVWQLGGINSDFTFSNDISHGPLPFRMPHRAHELHNGNILLFDSWEIGKDGTGVYGRHTSRAVEYKMNGNSRLATKVWEFVPPQEIISVCSGNVQRLPNDNTMIFFGKSLLKNGQSSLNGFEVSPSSQVLRSFFAVDVRAHRMWLLSWRAISQRGPRVVACIPVEPRLNHYALRIYVSCNGATEIIKWRFEGSADAEELEKMNRRRITIRYLYKRHFEDNLSLQSIAGSSINSENFFYLRVVPIDRRHRDLKASRIVQVPLPSSGHSSLACGCIQFDVGVQKDLNSYLNHIVFEGFPKIETIFVDILECQKLCRGIQECAGFSFEEASRTCVLRRNLKASESVPGYVSGPPQC